VIQERTKDVKEDVSAANREDTLRHIAQREEVVEETPETDTMVTEEEMIELVVDMAEETAHLDATFLEVAHQETDEVVSVTTHLAHPLVRERITVLVREVHPVVTIVMTVEAPLTTISDCVSSKKYEEW